jgi:hypothetical protein
MASEYQRAFVRKRVAFAIEVTAVVRDGASLAVPAGPHFHGVEISAGGMGFETKVPLRRGDQLTIQFTLPGETLKLKLSMQIMHITTMTEESRKGFIRAGGRFDRMEPTDHSYLNNYIGTTFILY